MEPRRDYQQNEKERPRQGDKEIGESKSSGASEVKEEDASRRREWSTGSNAVARCKRIKPGSRPLIVVWGSWWRGGSGVRGGWPITPQPHGSLTLRTPSLVCFCPCTWASHEPHHRFSCGILRGHLQAHFFSISCLLGRINPSFIRVSKALHQPLSSVCYVISMT